MKLFAITVLLTACITGTALFGEEGDKSDLQKIEMQDGMFYQGGSQINNQAQLLEIIRSANDERANSHLDSANSLMTVGIICSVSGGLALGGAFGVGLAGIGGGDYTGAFVMGGVALGLIITGLIVGGQAQGEFFAAVDRYNAVVDERQPITVSLGPIGRGIGIRISF